MIRRTYSVIEGIYHYDMPIMPICDLCNEPGDELCDLIVYDYSESANIFQSYCAGRCQAHLPQEPDDIEYVDSIGEEAIEALPPYSRQNYFTTLRIMAENAANTSQVVTSPKPRQKRRDVPELDNNPRPKFRKIYSNDEDIRSYIITGVKDKRNISYLTGKSGKYFSIKLKHRLCHTKKLVTFCTCCQKDAVETNYCMVVSGIIVGICDNCIQYFTLEGRITNIPELIRAAKYDPSQLSTPEEASEMSPEEINNSPAAENDNNTIDLSKDESPENKELMMPFEDDDTLLANVLGNNPDLFPFDDLGLTGLF